MALISSPIVCPLVSSPQRDSPRKRRNLGVDRKSLPGVVHNVKLSNKTLAGFLLDDDDDNGEVIEGTRSLWTSRTRETLLTPPSTVSLGSPVTEEGHNDRTHNTERAQAPKSVPPLEIHIPFERTESNRTIVKVCTASGKPLHIYRQAARKNATFEEIVAARSTSDPDRAKKSYYGVDIHHLLSQAKKESAKAVEEAEMSLPSVEQPLIDSTAKAKNTLMWTEKYRAKRFKDLVGDERTHRSVLKWLKGWDSIVFPHRSRHKPKVRPADVLLPERPHRKIMLLTGPPGLGKTTLAHVCARQAGYEVQEINASDERSRDVVRGRIRDMVGTENVRPMAKATDGEEQKAARPICVVVDEVDGVVGSSGGGGGGEGGFIKALIDLIALDQRSTKPLNGANTTSTRKKKGEHFRMLRPIILICNDVYHPSLRLLRQGTFAEIIHIRRPPLTVVVPRLQAIFAKEHIPCDADGVRHLCEAAWGVSNRKEDRGSSSSTGEGDMRGILVVGEWVARKMRAFETPESGIGRLTRNWLEQHILGDLAQGGGASRSLGRGGTREVVERVFTYNAGFSAAPSIGSKDITINSANSNTSTVSSRLTAMIASSGDDDRIMSDCFSLYPTYPFQDDTLLSKPCAAHDWLYFHDLLSHRVHSSQEWELAAYLSQPVLAFHGLFASNSRHSYAPATTTDDAAYDPLAKPAHPLTTPRAAFAASEATKANLASLATLAPLLSMPLRRAFRSDHELVTELLPYALRILNPQVKPVVIGGSSGPSVSSVRRASEKERVRRAVECMHACGLRFEQVRLESVMVEGGGAATAPVGGGWVYRMEPAVDILGVFETAELATSTAEGEAKLVGGDKVRYAVRAVLAQEHARETLRREAEARVKRSQGPGGEAAEVQVKGPTEGVAVARSKLGGGGGGVKRDFFGRQIAAPVREEGKEDQAKQSDGSEAGRIWVTYHEGYSNAVRKGITMRELLDGL